MGGACWFCETAAVFRPPGGVQVCASCALRVADAAAEGDAGIWANDGVSAARASRDAPETENAFEAFRRGIANAITNENAEAHADLAQAYAEMALLRDARREAAIAVCARGKAPVTEHALGILLTAPLLRADGLRRLRERLRQPLH